MQNTSGGVNMRTSCHTSTINESISITNKYKQRKALLGLSGNIQV